MLPVSVKLLVACSILLVGAYGRMAWTVYVTVVPMRASSSEKNDRLMAVSVSSMMLSGEEDVVTVWPS